MFTALVLLFIVIMLVVLIARALSERPYHRYPTGYPDMSQMPPQQMPPQATYSDPYSDTGYYQSGEYSQNQGSGTPPPKEADAYERGYEQGYSGYTSRSEPEAMPRADEAAAAYEEERLRSNKPRNYDSSYYQPGTSSPEYVPPRDTGSEQYNQPQRQYGSGSYPPQGQPPSYQQPPYVPYSQQQGYERGNPPYQQQQPYGPQYPQQQQYYGPYPAPYPPQQRSGMNPWVAGGLGAIMGYGLGNLFAHGDRPVPMEGGDFGGFGDNGGFGGGGDFGGDSDFGGGDFGGDSGGGDF